MNHLFPHLFAMPWHDILVPPVSVLEKILRVIAVYLFLIFALKAWGKRVMAQLNPFDLVVLLILSNTVQNAIIGNDNSVSGGLIGAVALLVFNNFVVRRLYGHSRVERWFEGKPDLLIEHGKIRDEILRRDGVSKHEVVMAAHKQGFDSLGDIEKAVLAPGGGLWFFRHVPTTDEARQTELLARLDRIEKLISARTPPAAG
jgi:uncharacterized membrane protein YcaP (DUF421 family)